MVARSAVTRLLACRHGWVSLSGATASKLALASESGAAVAGLCMHACDMHARGAVHRAGGLQQADHSATWLSCHLLNDPGP